MSCDRALAPFGPLDLPLWDQACVASGRSRGLGHEALASASPLGWDGPRIVAAVPFAALAIALAQDGALPHLRSAFGDPSILVDFRHIPEAAEAAPSWAARLALLRLGEAREALLRFEDEPLASGLASRFGVRYDIDSFSPHDPGS